MTQKKRPIWGVISPNVPPGVLTGQAKMLEQAGLEGLFATQVYGPPFVPLAAAAAVTERVRLASGIALAFARSPFETAMAAIDMDRISGGRFTLGLGCSVRAWSEGFFGMPYGQPLEHMREVVEIVRLIIARAHTGELNRYQGKYHTHDWSELQPTAPPADGPAGLDRRPARPPREPRGRDRRRRHGPPDVVGRLGDDEDDRRP